LFAHRLHSLRGKRRKKEEENLLGFVEDEEMKGKKIGSNCQDREGERE
jgi:hypothetical protein